ncbi:MAG TPA: hypothetical protein VHS06_08060 [Chloroflexota bacterium]|nr:hypothetical protein [Chloroflexota bacterium]
MKTVEAPQSTAKLPTVKEMPAAEKFSKVIADARFTRDLVTPFVREHISEEAVSELRNTWRQGIQPIPKDAPPEEKYEKAYANTMWIGSSSLGFIREKLGEDGMDEWVRTEAEDLKRRNAGPAVLLLSLIRAVAPEFAFRMMAKQMSYELQWLTPFDVTELTGSKVVYSIPRCKVLDYPNTEDVCQVGCQRVYPQWQAEQFKARMSYERVDHSCTCTVTPLRKELK